MASDQNILATELTLLQILQQMHEARNEDRAEMAVLRQQNEEIARMLSALQLREAAATPLSDGSPSPTNPAPTAGPQRDRMEVDSSTARTSASTGSPPARAATAAPLATARPKPSHNDSSAAQIQAQVEAHIVARRRKPLPTGQPFSGDKRSFPAWKITMEHRLKADAEFIGGPRDQFVYIWSNLGPAVQMATALYYQEEGIHQWNPLGFIEYLEFSYGDPHARERA
jgi:hypothetical protein